MMMRYLIHVIGDIHQPLHASSLFSQMFINGDEGGNLFLIKYSEEINNLHKLFDSGVGKFQNDIKRPLNKEDLEYLDKTSLEIIKDFNKEDLPEMKKENFSEWLQESHDISQSFIYKGNFLLNKEIKFDGSPSHEYIDKAYNYIRRRVALGGYRLADLIKKIYSTYHKVKIESELKILNFLN